MPRHIRIAQFVIDEDGLVGRLLDSDGPEWTVVREGDCGTLEEFGYSAESLNPATSGDLAGLDVSYIDALFSYR